MDFSSLRFTSETTPKYKLKSPNKSAVCIYSFLSETTNAPIRLIVTYFDYNDPGFGGKVNTVKTKELFQRSFSKRKNNTNLYSSYVDTEIGDEAFFPFSKNADEKSLHF